MPSPRTDETPASAAGRIQTPPAKSGPRSLRERASLAIQLILSLAVVGGVFAYLWWSGKQAPSPDDEKRPAPREEVVQVVGPRTIRVRAGTPLDGKLHVAVIEAAWLTAPVLPVTGTALASLRPGNESATDTWQFATPDLLTAFSDWQKAVVDVQFQQDQLRAVRELAEYRVEAQKKVVKQMEDLLKIGTERQKDLFAEQVNLRQYEIQGKKDTHEAENAVKVAQKTEATLARQLQQAGLEPTMLRSAAAEGEIIVADVPERVVSRVRLGMTCTVRFFALPNREFTGKVSSVAPVISKEKRALSVQFTVKDPDNLVRPGMFAEIGLGTDKREALLMPADGVLHVGDRDYALRAADTATWQIAEVETGELRGSSVEVLAGLKAGYRVLGKGAILLKPVVAHALESPAPADSAATANQASKGDGR
jgi:hypothetical protein